MDTLDRKIKLLFTLAPNDPNGFNNLKKNQMFPQRKNLWFQTCSSSKTIPSSTQVARELNRLTPNQFSAWFSINNPMINSYNRIQSYIIPEW